MRSSFSFDPGRLDFGPATQTVRQLLSEWSEVEWLTPPRTPRSVAHERFREHHRLARAYLPAQHAERIELSPAAGGWAEFSELCAKVRSTSSWDWKYSVLKTVSGEHSRAHGWSTDEKLRQLQAVPDLGNLFMNINGGILWILQCQWPPFEPVAGPHAESGSFYFSYCFMDLVDAIEWQLAEPRAPLAQNPFYLLLRCYAAGHYPFSLGPASTVMYAFTLPG